MSEHQAASTEAWTARAEQIIRRGPVTLAELRGQLGRDLGDLELADVMGHLDDVDCSWIGDRIAHDDLILSNAVVTHRLTRDELRHGYLIVEPDLTLVSYTWAPRRPLLSGGWLKHASPYDVGAHELAPQEQLLDGPRGWLGRFSPGDLVGLAWHDDAIEVVTVDPEALVEDDVCDVLAGAFDAVCDGDGVAETWQVAAEAALRRPGVWHAPRPPLIELLARAGLCVDGDEVAPTGFDWDVMWSGRASRAHGAPWSDLPDPSDADQEDDGDCPGAVILPFPRRP